MPERGTRTAYRIAAFYAVSFAAASLILGAATWSFASRTLRRGLDDRLQGELSFLVRAGAREGRAALIEDIVARDLVPNAGGDLLIDSKGRRVAGGVDIAATPVIGLSDVRIRRAGGSVPGRSAATVLPNGETLAVVAESGSLARIETTLLMISGAGFGLMVAIGVGGGFWIGHSIHRRLSALDAAAVAIIDGDPARRMPIGPRGDEFDRLSHTLNRMLDHIGQLMDSLRHVSDDIAHDLRTPLARLLAALEVAAEGDDPGALRAGIAEALGRVDAVMDLFAAILRISEVERGGARSRFAPVRLDLLAADILEDYVPAAADAGRAISASIAPETMVRGNEGLIGQAIVNLIENAIKHTRVGTRIVLIVAPAAEARVALTVRDDGLGVPAGEWPAILRRFGRREASRSTAGNGLGLTLVAAIAAAHRAELVLADAAPGFSVTLLFPREADD